MESPLSQSVLSSDDALSNFGNGTSLGSSSSCIPSISSEDIARHVCYGCHNLCRDAQEFGFVARKRGLADSTLALPGFVAAEIRKRDRLETG